MSYFESCVWRAVSSHSSHHPYEVLLAQFSLYVHKGGLKPHSCDKRRYSGLNILAAILDAILNNGKGSSGNHGELKYVVSNGIGKISWKNVYRLLLKAAPWDETFSILSIFNFNLYEAM